MNRVSTFLVVLVLLTALGTAQDKFKVLATRGSVTLDGGKKLSVGQKLKLSDKITVAKGGYASLAHVNGRTVEVRKEGTIKISELDKAVSKKTGSVSGKFATYVVGELTEVKEPITFTDNRRSNMRTTGSVERATGDEVSLADSVLRWVEVRENCKHLPPWNQIRSGRARCSVVIMPRHTRLLTDTVQFTWHRSAKIPRYKLVVTDRDDKVIVTRETTDTTLTITMSSIGMQNNALYYWHVEKSDNADERTAEYALWMLGGSDRTVATELIASVNEDMEDASSAIGALVLAAAYEDQGLNYDAYRCYRDAMAAAPEIQNYKRLYAEFLLRQSLNLDAYLAYNK
ncbi:MAG: hypothetical protein IPH49_09620 [Ignavibacteria bacterium]|nr:hypothetical protein [Ignavibacteria bacterium]